MKKLFFILLIPLFVFAEANSPFEKELPFKEATVYYKVGKNGTGEAKLYIKDYGKKTSEYEKKTITYMGFKQSTETLNITTPNWIYEIDLINKIGSKTPNTDKYIKEEFNKLSYADKKKVLANAQKMGTSLSGNSKIQINNKIILGYSCDKVEFMGLTSYSIHKTSLPLHISGNIMGVDANKIATKIQKNSVSSSHFSIPVDINVEFDPNSIQIAKDMAQNIITMLKDPDSYSGDMSQNMQNYEQPEEQPQQEVYQEEITQQYDEDNIDQAQAEEQYSDETQQDGANQKQDNMQNALGGIIKSFQKNNSEENDEQYEEPSSNKDEKTKEAIGNETVN